MRYLRITLVVLFLSALFSGAAAADDTCIFSVTADDVPPDVVLLLDNGAEMEQIMPHADYDSAIDYTPVVLIRSEGVNGFFNAAGYAVIKSGPKYYIQAINADLSISSSGGIVAAVNNQNIWTINGRTIILPATPSTVVDGFGIKDNATVFRYSANYLNWLFFSGLYTGDGTDLFPAYSRFYYAKQAILDVAKTTSNKANFAVFNFANDVGASSVQPMKQVVTTVDPVDSANNVLDSNFVNTINNMGTVTYSPLAEGLASVGNYYGSAQIKQYVSEEYCQKNFIIVLSAGLSSHDGVPDSSSTPATFSDYDGDDAVIGEGNIQVDGTVSAIPVNVGGTTDLDDVAAYLHDNNVVYSSTGTAWKNVSTYTVGLSTTPLSKAFLINTSNNGNGNDGLYDTANPLYGHYHFEAEDATDLSDRLQKALNSILSQTTTFTAPVVPVTRTTSGDWIYLAFFKPMETNFWQGNITKFGLSASNQILDRSGNDATWPNGAMKADAVPYWSTLDWSEPSASNYMANGSRNIYTYFGRDSDLTAADNAFLASNEFSADSTDNLTLTALGAPVSGSHPREDLINYIRGADAYDEDGDGDVSENRSLITGDALHSEPAVFTYIYQSGGGAPNTAGAITRVFFGANDGMLHAVRDEDGTEAWGFVPPDLLSRLRLLVEGSGHQIYVDASPRIYFHDVDGDGNVDIGDDRVILVVGERQGGASYWALDITYPGTPKLLWTINSTAYPELAETWSEPVFGKVRTSANDTVGTPVMVVGGGYSWNNTGGRGVGIFNVLTGTLIKGFKYGVTSGMDYSIVSNITAIDSDNNGFLDKVYVGDLGGQMWRIGKFTDSGGTLLPFPKTDENVNDWEAHVLFSAGCSEADCTDGVDNDGDGLIDEWRKFFYAPDIALEIGYDLVLTGTGDRQIPCDFGTEDRIMVVQDNHQDTNLNDGNYTDAGLSPFVPSATQKGWYRTLQDGEKVLSEGVLFNKIFYVTSFLPTTAPCVPGGFAYLYGLDYLTGEPAADFDNNGTPEEKVEIGGGIASKPVVVLHDEEESLLISVGSTVSEAASESTTAGVISQKVSFPTHNFFLIWWRELFD